MHATVHIVLLLATTRNVLFPVLKLVPRTSHSPTTLRLCTWHWQHSSWRFALTTTDSVADDVIVGRQCERRYKRQATTVSSWDESISGVVGAVYSHDKTAIKPEGSQTKLHYPLGMILIKRTGVITSRRIGFRVHGKCCEYFHVWTFSLWGSSPPWSLIP